jgi:Aspartyl/Asparaginyl beta-hydroxylase
MDQLFHKIDLNFDIAKLQEELEHILTLTQWHSVENQISLQYTQGEEDNAWYSGCGKLGEWRDKKWFPRFKEKDFNIINPALKGTYFEHVLNNMPFKPVRTRIMNLEPKRCYSVHRDDTNRYHLALVTNYHARFIFTKEEKVYHIPADGNLYFVDTIKEHTAINGGNENRIHMVLLPS